MNVNEFVVLYKDKNDSDRIEFIKHHITRSYIPIEEKDARANIIVKNSYYEGDDFKINSVAKYVFTYLTIIDIYTDIEIDYKNSVEEYNKLDELGIIRNTISVINKIDLDEFNDILKMKCEDVMINEYDIHHYINKQVERFISLFGNIIGPALEGIDLDKVQQVMNDIVSNNELEEE